MLFASPFLVLFGLGSGWVGEAVALLMVPVTRIVLFAAGKLG